jgi:hypothetical protein
LYGDDSISKFVGVNSGNGALVNGAHNIVAGNSGLIGKDNQWHHLVANLGQSEVSLYVDGVLAAQYGGFGTITQNNSNLYFGRHRALGRYYNGLLDDVRLYNGAISQSEVSNLFANTNSVVPEPSALAIWSFIAITGIGVTARRRRANRRSA